MKAINKTVQRVLFSISGLAFSGNLMSTEKAIVNDNTASQATSEIDLNIVKIRNKTMGNNFCFNVNNNGEDLSFIRCADSESQKWYFSENGTIRNLSDTSKCLTTLDSTNTESTVKYGVCDDNAINSKQAWFINRNVDGSISIKNKYASELAPNNTLSADLASQTVTMSIPNTAQQSKWSLSKPLYQTLTNSASEQNTCLSLSTNGIDVTFLPCNGDSKQNWHFSNNGYIRNQSQKTKCLKSDNGRKVNYGACSGSGFTSQRIWFVATKAGGSLELQNKFNNDLKHNETLNFNAGNNSVHMSKSANNEAQWHYTGILPETSIPVLGNKTVLLMATHFNGFTPASPAPIKKAVFGDGDDYASLKHYLKIASKGKLSITGTFLSGINLGVQPTSCGKAQSEEMRTKARNAARKAGVEPNDFDYLFVDISNTKSCTWAGLASKPGNWILSNASGHKVWMWSHEFGHNLGYEHSKTVLNCLMKNDIVQLNGFCTIGGGADPTDTMGGGGKKIFPINYQTFSGWSDFMEVPFIKEIGTYKLTPLWKDDETGSQSYRIKRHDGSELTLEFRRSQQGFDAWPEDSPFINGVIVRVTKTSNNTITNYLVDATPDSPGNTDDAPLMPGHSLYDALSGYTIAVISADKTGAVIKVTQGENVLPVE